MNDTELDRLLELWRAPAPSPSLRRTLRGQFPRAERRRFIRPVLWALAIAAASVTLAIGMEHQGPEGTWNYRLVRLENLLYEKLFEVREVRRATSTLEHIRQSQPRVYVDGQLVGPLAYGPAATMEVEVPGEGAYSVTNFPGGLTGWIEAGHIHGSLIEFEAGGKQVRIECSQPVVDSDRPVFVRRR